MAFLILLGLLTIYSATSDIEGEMAALYKRQLLYAGIGLAVFIATLFIPQRVYYALSYLIYMFAIILLVLVIVVNKGTEPARWFNLGIFNFQPSEAAKVAMILAIGRFLDEKKKAPEKFSVTFRVLLLMLFPVVLVAIEPDLGTAAIFAFICTPIMIMGGIKPLHLIILVMPLIVMFMSFSIYTLIPVILLFFLLLTVLKLRFFFVIFLTIINVGIGISSPKIWNSLHPYQQQRIKTFINPEADPRGAGYQIIQSKIAVGSGGFSGKGYLHGTQGHLKFLPAGHTDFIFSVLSEEWGFVGASAVIFAFLLFSYRSLVIAGKCRNRFSQLVIVGGTAHFASHALVNIGMSIGMMPVTGLPLPFMSYGGSALILNMTLAGIMVSLGLRWREY